MNHTPLLLGLAVCLLSAAAAPAVPAGFVTRQGSKLMLDGREYRAIGVNIPNLHQAYMGTWFHIQQIYGSPEKAKQAMVDAIVDAEKSHLAFIRFFADPGYPRDRAMLYEKDPAHYWQLMDQLFALCKQHHVKLVPVLGTIPGPYLFYGETGQSILDPASKTYQAVHRYITEFVTRYKDDPTVLMWELTNEGMLAADVDMAGWKLLPAGVYPPGMAVRATGTRADSLTWAMYGQLYREQAAFIHGLDPNHLVESGDSCVRPECTSRRDTFPDFKYRPDTWREWLGNNLASQPEPLDLYSFHFYGNDEVAGAEVPWAGMTRLQEMRQVVEVVHAAGAPVFIGELGASPNNKADPHGKWVCKAIDSMEQEGVSLMALWVWHFSWQPEFTMDSTTYPEIVKRAGQFNKKWAAGVG
jgi:hypothetical protein